MKQNTKRIPAKGTSRRVVIVRGEDDSLFEQIIYVVRDDRVSGTGVSAEHVLREAVRTIEHETAIEEPEPHPFVFSRILLMLVVTALLLTAVILIYIFYCGWN